jgi:hypothetical protein
MLSRKQDKARRRNAIFDSAFENPTVKTAMGTNESIQQGLTAGATTRTKMKGIMQDVRQSGLSRRNKFKRMREAQGDTVDPSSELAQFFSGWGSIIDEEFNFEKPPTLEEQIKENPSEKVSVDYENLRSDFEIPLDLLGKRGTQPGEKVANQSYFNTEIIERGLAGNSRMSGDASPEVQKQVIDLIIKNGRESGMSDREIAIVLSIARHESGFNPDASAKTSSASGVGQFINSTGAKYGMNDENRWDANAQVNALIKHTQDNIARVNKADKEEVNIYELHHDGSFKNGKGLRFSKKNIMPFVDKYEKFLETYGVSE